MSGLSLIHILAHVTWFFETFVLERFEPGFKPHHPAFRVLFNSYYNGVGEQHPRPQRGLVTRPGLAEVRAYRAAVDERVLDLLARDALPDLAALSRQAAAVIRGASLGSFFQDFNLVPVLTVCLLYTSRCV